MYILLNVCCYYASHPQVPQRIWHQRLHFPRERPVEGGGVVEEDKLIQLGQLAQLRGMAR